MAGIKINQYPLERLAFGDDDYYDIDYWNGSAFETAKIKGSVIKTAIQAGITSENIMDTNSLVLAGNFTHDLNSNNLVFDDGSVRVTNGDLGVLGGFNAQHDGVGALPIASFISSGGNPVLIIDNTKEALGIGTGSPQVDSILDITSTSKAVLLPRLTTTQRNNIGSPSESMLIYNTTTDQFEFYSASGTWDALGAGGDSIYSADGTVTADRSVNLDTKVLTFDAGTTTTTAPVGIVLDSQNVYSTGTSAPAIFKVLGLSGNEVFNLNSRGYFISTSDYTTAIAKIENRAGTQGLTLANNVSDIASTQFRHLATNSDITDRIEQTVTNVYQQWIMTKNNVKSHWIRNGDSASQACFFIEGVTGRGFNVGGGDDIDGEKISLQDRTAIKGAGTTTGTTLALYDDDTTPNKTWEWLDNGDVNIGQDSIFDLNTNKLEFKNSANTNSLLILDDNAQTTISNTISGLFLQYAGSTQTGKVTILSSSVIVNAEKFETRNQSGTHTALDIDNNSTNGKISINNSVGTQMEWSNDKVGITGSSTKIIRNNVIRAYFADAFTIFGSDNTTTISGEDISLQGSTLINSTLNMNNNRILNSVVNPSVQEATNSATFTINADQETDGVLTAMSANTTIASPTGTPVQSQDLVFRFKDDGTARTLTWNAIFRAIGVTLPTTTVANKLTYVGCKYNSTDTKWDVIAVQQEA